MLFRYDIEFSAAFHPAAPAAAESKAAGDETGGAAAAGNAGDAAAAAEEVCAAERVQGGNGAWTAPEGATASRQGKVVLTWSNRYSWRAAKTVFYGVRIDRRASAAAPPAPPAEAAPAPSHAAATPPVAP